MKRIRTVMPVVLLCLATGGCAAVSRPAAYDDESWFHGLWTTYMRCTGGNDLDLILTDLARLRREARQRTEHFTPVPSVVAAVVPTPPVRLTVDPGALAAACALHAGELARTTGHLHVATALFRSVVEFHGEEGYASYVARARAAVTVIAAGPMAPQEERLLASLPR